ncbi:carbamoyltransferase HypF [Spongiivirga sp. MCCC 1A20706]|uniref:carbamoyltransferase HypF n=1 Tax=Spongiivirga sp. MCCC 1A20706 TaxID=3160963 RepID=UPI0039778B48
MQTHQIHITGQVQGVGFRPHVFHIAKKYGLLGTVCNDGTGVVIKVNADKDLSTTFTQEIITKAPEVANIQNWDVKKIEPQQFSDFKIIPSEKSRKIHSALTADFGICLHCADEIQEPENRRFQYPFTTCIHCGPRFALTEKFPFEREHTALSEFNMCAVCQEEYTNPENRRFHSQTNSCPACGPQLKITNAKGEEINGNQDQMLSVSNALENGKIVALKNTSGYLLLCDASNAITIQQLRDRKKRPSKPLALLYPDINSIEADFDCSIFEKQCLESVLRPIVLLKPKNEQIHPQNVAPKLNNHGVMLPSSALLVLISQHFGKPLIATSGNIHGSPIISDAHEAIEKLNKVADVFVHHNLNIEHPQDDSVVRFVEDYKIIIRRGRGLAPNYFDYTGKQSAMLALGAHLKSTIAYIPYSNCYISPYLGNLDHYEVQVRLEAVIETYNEIFQTKPSHLIVDKHPTYASTVLGRSLQHQYLAELYEVQHHKAHFASVLSEHNSWNVKEPILGVIWDGTGFGEDDTIWGGEFFTYHKYEIKHKTQLEPFVWIAGDNMAKQPRLSLLSLINKNDLAIIKEKFSNQELAVYNKLIEKKELQTSSVGRLFDALASLLCDADFNTYEGEAPMQLETLASTYDEKDLIDLLPENNFSGKALIANCIHSLKDQVPKKRLAASIHFTLANSIIKQAKKMGISTVACSGGVFQNAQLVKQLIALTEKENIELLLNRALSCNDENISFGQLMYVQHIKKETYVFSDSWKN